MPHSLPRPSDPPPRGLLIAAAGWVLASLLIAYGLRPPILPLASTYAPAARIALVTMLVGAVIAWPLLRLSQRSAASPVRRTLLDLVVLTGAFQVTLWPLRLAAAWPIGRTLAIDAWCLGWMLLAAAFPILGGLVRTHRGRTLLMAVLLVVVIGPVLFVALARPETASTAAAGGPIASPMAWSSPFGGLARLAAPGRLDLLPQERTAAAAALGGGVAAAGLALAAALALPRRGRAPARSPT